MRKFIKNIVCILLLITTLLFSTACNPLTSINLFATMFNTDESFESSSLVVSSDLSVSSQIIPEDVSSKTKKPTAPPQSTITITEVEPEKFSKPVPEKEIEFNVPTSSSSASLTQDQYYYASRLPSELKSAYNKLKQAVATRTVGMISLGKLTAAQTKLIFVAVKNDFPEYFWMPNAYLISEGSTDTKIALETPDDTNGVSYLANSSQRISMAAELNKAIRLIYTEISNSVSNKTPYDIELFIHDWLCKNVTYNDDAVNDPDGHPQAFTAYGALVEGSAVCEGYSRAAQLILNAFGIKNGLICGTTDDGEGHMWNIVNIDSKWYHLDITWDDDDEVSPYHFFFNLSDSLITRDRKISPELKTDYSNHEDPWNFKLPECSSLDKHYFTINSGGLSNNEVISTTIGKGILESATNSAKKFEYYGYADFAFLNSSYTVNDVRRCDLRSVLNSVNKSIKSKVYINNYTVTLCDSGFRINYTMKNK